MIQQRKSRERERERDLEIVIPLFNEEMSIDELVSSLNSVVAKIGVTSRLFLVDDGSTDKTWEKIESHAKKIQKSAKVQVVGIRLQRNYGQMIAFDCGLELTTADFVVTMDGDMQHPPSFLVDLWEKRGTDYCVAARQIKRTDVLYKRFFSRTFYKFISIISGIKFESNVSDFRIIPRSLLSQLLESNDSPRIMRFLIPKLGLKQIYLDYLPSKRIYGRSSYNFGKMIKLAVSSVITTTTKLLRISFIVSLLYALFTSVVFVYGIFIMFSGNGIPGYLSVLFTLTTSFTGIFLTLGIFGLYLERILDSTNRIPLKNANKIQRIEDGSHGFCS
jgi:dolichol-phosphate mannosyltransferase